MLSSDVGGKKQKAMQGAYGGQGPGQKTGIITEVNDLSCRSEGGPRTRGAQGIGFFHQAGFGPEKFHSSRMVFIKTERITGPLRWEQIFLSHPKRENSSEEEIVSFPNKYF